MTRILAIVLALFFLTNNVAFVLAENGMTREEFFKDLEKEKEEFRNIRKKGLEQEDFKDIRRKRDEIQNEWSKIRLEILNEWLMERDAIRKQVDKEKRIFIRIYGSEEKAIKGLWGSEASNILEQRKYNVTSATETDYSAYNIESSGIVKLAAGESVDDAKKRALKIALNELADSISKIKPTNEQSVGTVCGEEAVEDFVIQNSDFSIQETQLIGLPDGSSAVKVDVDGTLDTESVSNLTMPFLESTEKAENYTIQPDGIKTAKKKVKTLGPYSGLVIDARGVGLKPCLVLSVVANNGKELYGASTASKQYISKTGMVGWAKTVDPARPNLRVGENPLVVKADTMMGGDSIVLNTSNADLIRVADNDTGFLHKGRVVVVVD